MKGEKGTRSGVPRHLQDYEILLALEAFIDLHIADPTLAPILEDELPIFIGRFQAYNERRVPRVKRVERRLRRLGASAQARLQIQARRGEIYVEEVCGWIEQKRAYGKTFEIFHPGLAGLTKQECRVLDLAQRFQTESGRPDFVRIAPMMTSPKAEGEAVKRQTALQTLRRARIKVQEYWKTLGVQVEEEKEEAS